MDRNEGMDRSKFSVNMADPMSIVIDVRLRLTRALDRHQYDLPTSDEVSILLASAAQPCDIA